MDKADFKRTKVSLPVCYDCWWIIQFVFLSDCKKIAAKKYCSQLSNRNEAIQEKQPICVNWNDFIFYLKKKSTFRKLELAEAPKVDNRIPLAPNIFFWKDFSNFHLFIQNNLNTPPPAKNDYIHQLESNSQLSFIKNSKMVSTWTIWDSCLNRWKVCTR